MRSSLRDYAKRRNAKCRDALSESCHEVCTMCFAALTAALHECRLIFENLKCVLQAFDFSLATCFSPFVGLRLSNAPFLNLRIVFQHSCELSVRGVPVGREL